MQFDDANATISYTATPSKLLILLIMHATLVVVKAYTQVHCNCIYANLFILLAVLSWNLASGRAGTLFRIYTNLHTITL